MQADEAWSALGDLLAVELERATADVTRRFADEIKLRLQYFKTTAAQRETVDKATRGTFDARAVLLSYAGETRDLSVRRRLRELWEDVAAEHGDEPAPTRWKALDRAIREELDGIHAEGDQLVAGLGDIASTDRRAWTWPLASRRQLSDVITAWRTDAAERMRVPVESLLDPETVEDRHVYRWIDAAANVSNLAVWLEERAAWAKALYDVEPVIAAFV